MMFINTLIFVILVAVYVCNGQDWEPPRRDKLYPPGELTTILTECDKNSYEHAFYSVARRKSVTFSVKACAAATLTLTFNTIRYEFEHQNAYYKRVVLGDHGNQRVAMTSSDDENVSVEVNHPLSCREFRQFWLRWGSNGTELGRGPIPGDQPLLVHGAGDAHEFNAFVLSCGTNQAAVWQIPENTGNELLLYTEPFDEYRHLWKAVETRDSISFQLRACESVLLALTSHYGNTDGNIYEFVLGNKKNTESILRLVHSGSDAEVVARSTGKHLTCLNYDQFWISWKEHTITLGKGPALEGNILFSYEDPDPIPVRYLSVGSMSSMGGVNWVFEDDLEPYSVVVTHPDRPYSGVWLEVVGEPFITFSVSACSSAAIALTTNKGESARKNYEVIIGTEGNTLTVIKQGGLVLAENNTESLLHCHEFWDFWLSWHDMKIELGMHSTYGMLPILSHDIPNEDLRYVSFAGLKDKAIWKIGDTMGESISVYTDRSSQVEQPLWRQLGASRQSIVFTIQACSAAKILLASSMGINDKEFHHEIWIGVGTEDNVQIRTIKGISSTTLATGSAPDLVSCVQARQIWVSWAGSKLMLGRGPLPGRSVVLPAGISSGHRIQYAAFITTGGNTAEWNIAQNEGDRVLVHTGQKLTYAHWLSVERHISWLTFQVQACTDATVTLSPGVNDLTETLEVVLNNRATDRCLLRSSRLEGVVDDSYVKDILSCSDARQFWIKWQDGIYEVGRGSVPMSSSIFLMWRDETPFQVQAMSFATSGHLGGIWFWPENSASHMKFTTSGSDGERNGIDVTSRQDMVVHVQACSDVIIRLWSGSDTATHSYVYKVHLGDASDMSSIQDNGAVSAVSISRPSPGILHCEQQRTFWLTWYSGQVRLGTGSSLGHTPLLDFQEMVPQHIRFLSMETGPGVKGTWTLPLLQHPDASKEEESVKGNAQGSHSSGATRALIGVFVTLVVICVIAVALVLLNKRGYLDDMKIKLGM